MSVITRLGLRVEGISVITGLGLRGEGNGFNQFFHRGYAFTNSSTQAADRPVASYRI